MVGEKIFQFLGRLLVPLHCLLTTTNALALCGFLVKANHSQRFQAKIHPPKIPPFNKPFLTSTLCRSFFSHESVQNTFAPAIYPPQKSLSVLQLTTDEPEHFHSPSSHIGCVCVFSVTYHVFVVST